MLGLEHNQVLGAAWERLAAMVEAGASLVDLPDTGRATLPRRGQDLHLEARTSASKTVIGHHFSLLWARHP